MNNFFKDLKSITLENKGQSEWSSIYLLIVFAIVALILISFIKPMFQQAQKTVQAKTGPTLGN